MADNHARHAGERGSGDVQARCLQMVQIPGGRIRELEVGIICQNGLAGSGAFAADDPGVGAGLHLDSGARWKEKLHHLRFAAGEKIALQNLIFPTRGEGAIHVQPDGERIDHRPGARIVAENGELHGQCLAMGFDEVIRAAGKGRHDNSILRPQAAILLFGDPANA